MGFWLYVFATNIWAVIIGLIEFLSAIKEISEILYDLTKPWRRFRKQFRHFYRDVERYREEHREPEYFYRPTNISWGDVFAGRDYPRRRYIDEIVKFAKAGELVAVLGEPFSGKSAIMMRAAVELLNEGYSVFELRSDIYSLEIELERGVGFEPTPQSNSPDSSKDTAAGLASKNPRSLLL